MFSSVLLRPSLDTSKYTVVKKLLSFSFFAMLTATGVTPRPTPRTPFPGISRGQAYSALAPFLRTFVQCVCVCVCNKPYKKYGALFTYTRIHELDTNLTVYGPLSATLCRYLSIERFRRLPMGTKI